MPGNWNREDEAELLRAICQVKAISVGGDEWEAIASKMSANYSGNACRYGTLTIEMPFFISLSPVPK
jgi:hypothetical protein